jgi:hypothetical protein
MTLAPDSAWHKTGAQYTHGMNEASQSKSQSKTTKSEEHS